MGKKGLFALSRLSTAQKCRRALCLLVKARHRGATEPSEEKPDLCNTVFGATPWRSVKAWIPVFPWGTTASVNLGPLGKFLHT